jgi:hypothetical protein
LPVIVVPWAGTDDRLLRRVEGQWHSVKPFIEIGIEIEIEIEIETAQNLLSIGIKTRFR